MSTTSLTAETDLVRAIEVYYRSLNGKKRDKNRVKVNAFNLGKCVGIMRTLDNMRVEGWRTRVQAVLGSQYPQDLDDAFLRFESWLT